MPVLRGETKVRTLTDDQRKALRDKIAAELAGKSPANGVAVRDTPLIFEIPLELSDRKDILVVWDAFRDVPSEDRSAVILDAYKGQNLRIAQELGVSMEEALGQGLLPYAVRSMAKPEDLDGTAWSTAVRDEGGFPHPGSGEPQFYFPSRAMAEEARSRLAARIPTGMWAVADVIH
jgi:hypothetical protein